MEINIENLSEIGENIKATLQDGKLIIVIDTTKTIGPSKSGLMMGVGSTGGFTPLPGNLKGNIYVGRKA